MGSKHTNSYNEVDEENRTTEKIKELEDKYDKYETDVLEQYRIIEKYLIEDEIEFAKEVEEYRTKHKTYVITDRNILKKGAEIMMRKDIKWN
jgi:hypothetical protein